MLENGVGILSCDLARTDFVGLGGRGVWNLSLCSATSTASRCAQGIERGPFSDVQRESMSFSTSLLKGRHIVRPVEPFIRDLTAGALIRQKSLFSRGSRGQVKEKLLLTSGMYWR